MAKKRSRNKKKGGKKAPPTAPVDAAPAQPPAIPSTTGPVDAKQKSKAFKKKGNAAFVKKDFEAAVKHFTDAIQWEPTSHVLWSNRCAALTMMGQYPRAISDAKRCVQLNPKWSKGYARLGTACYRGQDLAGAASAFQTALELDPRNAIALKFMGQMAKAGVKTAPKAAPTEEATEDGEATKDESEEAANDGFAIGIDLGTTNSCVAVFRHGSVEIIPNEEGKRTTPSVVSFLDDNVRLVGDAAKAQAPSNPANTLYETKRLIGRLFTDSTVQADAKKLPFKLVKGTGDCPAIEITTKVSGGEGKEDTTSTTAYAPEQISALVLSKMKATAEKYLGCPVERAVVTVPAYFNDAQRNATKAAGAIAGLEVLRIINEPTAAALAYGLDQHLGGGESEANKKATHVLVFDLGGGTFDVSLLAIEDGIFEVRATGGDTHLGGEDFDDLLTAHLKIELKKKHPKRADDLLASPRVVRQLRRAAEQCKRTLSAASAATVELEDLIGKSDAEPVDFVTVVTRAKFERLCAEPFKRCIDTVKKVMKDGKMSVTEVDDVVLVGGSTRIPKVQDMLSKLFKGKKLCQSVNPDEAVAYGAAVQAAIMTGVRDSSQSQLLLVDVTPLSLGIETVGKVMSVIIKRNSTIPCEVTKTYTTDYNYQEAIDIPVFEGERSCVDGNNKLGEFCVRGIQRAKRGEPKIAVTFNLDADGILKVRARDEMTGAENNIEITNKGRLSEAEVARMVADAKRFEKEDAERMQQMEALHELEEQLYHAEDALTAFTQNGAEALSASQKRMQAMAELKLLVQSARMFVSSGRQREGSGPSLDTISKYQSKLESALFAFAGGR